MFNWIICKHNLVNFDNAVSKIGTSYNKQRYVYGHCGRFYFHKYNIAYKRLSDVATAWINYPIKVDSDSLKQNPNYGTSRHAWSVLVSFNLPWKTGRHTLLLNAGIYLINNTILYIWKCIFKHLELRQI